VVAHKRDRLFGVLESVRKSTVPRIDSIANKLTTPLRFATFFFGGTTIVLSALTYAL
jgi:hypothetical protein